MTMKYYINSTPRCTGKKRNTSILQFTVDCQQHALIAYEYHYPDVYEISPQGIN